MIADTWSFGLSVITGPEVTLPLAALLLLRRERPGPSIYVYLLPHSHTMPLRGTFRDALAIIICSLYIIAGQAHFTNSLTPGLAAQIETATWETYDAFTLGLPYDQVGYSLPFGQLAVYRLSIPYPCVGELAGVGCGAEDYHLTLLLVQTTSRCLGSPRCPLSCRPKYTDLGLQPRYTRVWRRIVWSNHVGWPEPRPGVCHVGNGRARADVQLELDLDCSLTQPVGL